MSVNRLLANGVTIIILIVFLIGILRYRKLSSELRYIFYFVVFGGITELFSDYYKAHIGRNTMPIGHIYIPLSILLLCFFYRKLLNGYIRLWIIDSLILAFIIFSVIDTVFIQSFFAFPNIIGACGALILAVLSVMYFSKIMTEAKIEKLWMEPLIWINSAILFYFAGSFFYYILFNINVKFSNEFARLTVRIFGILNIIFYALIGFIFMITARHKTTK